jgi:RNA polymerase sigma-70 factor (ECF subfamily)
MTEFPDTQSLLLANIQSLENREAWAEFVQIYRPVVYRMARRRGMQDADAQDLSQDVLVRVSKAIDRWEPQSGVRFRHWLRKVASNAIVTALKKSKQLGIVNGSAAERILAEATEVSAVTSELQDECFREQYLRAAAIVKVDVSPATWAAFEQTLKYKEDTHEGFHWTWHTPTGDVGNFRSTTIQLLQLETDGKSGPASFE